MERKRTIQLHKRIERVVLRVILRSMSIVTTQRPWLEMRACLQRCKSFDLRTKLHFRAHPVERQNGGTVLGRVRLPTLFTVKS